MEGKGRKIEVERTEAGKQTEAGKAMFELTESLKNHTIRQVLEDGITESEKVEKNESDNILA